MAYVALTVFRIPYPAPVGTPFIHLGNMVVILAALLIGGWQGGLSGSIGMGLFDLIFYPTSAFKTVILKFGIGLFTGLVARLGRGEKSRHPYWGLGTASAVSLVIGGILLFGKTFRTGKLCCGSCYRLRFSPDAGRASGLGSFGSSMPKERRSGNFVCHFGRRFRYRL